jgi:hypothetical protein
MSDTPQFGTAEYQPQENGDSCMTCGAPIKGQYFRINGAITCQACANATTEFMPKDTHGAFTRGILFGIGGAIIGLILYSVVGIVTGLEIGYVSLAVGYIVGRAFLFGTSGVGGRRHQIAAALFNYAAVSMSAVPIGLYYMMNERDSSGPAVVSAETTAIEEAELSEEATGEEAEEATEEDTEEAVLAATDDEASPSLGGLALYLAAMGLASPFLGMSSPVNGLIGLVILFVGIRIAWAMTAGSPVEITGPFNA